jgi:hypothetical protein
MADYSTNWVYNAKENFFYSLNLSRVLRHALQPKCYFRQFCTTKDPQSEGYVGLHNGSLYHWNIYGNLTGSPNDDGLLQENVEVPQGNFTGKQGTLEINERGMSVPYTGLLENLSFHSIKDIVDTVLSNDAKKKIDRSAYKEFKKAPLRVAPYNGTDTTVVVLSTTGSTAITNNVALGIGHVKSIRDIMFNRDIPPHRGSDYGCVSRADVLRPFKNNLEDIRKYTPEGYQKILNGEVGKYENIIFYEQTNITPANSPTLVSNWANGKSGEAIFFGNDTVAQAVVIPEEMRAKIPSDYGRSKGMMWYSLMGYGITHPRDDASLSHDARIIIWDSAA